MPLPPITVFGSKSRWFFEDYMWNILARSLNHSAYFYSNVKSSRADFCNLIWSVRQFTRTYWPASVRAPYGFVHSRRDSCNGTAGTANSPAYGGLLGHRYSGASAGFSEFGWPAHVRIRPPTSQIFEQPTSLPFAIREVYQLVHVISSGGSQVC